MSQAKTLRSSSSPGTPRSPTSSVQSSLPRQRRINISLPKASATSMSFSTPIQSAQDRERYAMLVSKNATSEALLKMPNVATKPGSTDDTDLALPAAAHAHAQHEQQQQQQQQQQQYPHVLKLPTVASQGITNTRVQMDFDLGLPQPRPSDRKFAAPSITSVGSSSNSIKDDKDQDKDDMQPAQKEIQAKRSSMNPRAPSFTPTFNKPTLSDCAVSENGENLRPSRANTLESRDSIVAGLGISAHRQELSVNTKVLSPSAFGRHGANGHFNGNNSSNHNNINSANHQYVESPTANFHGSDAYEGHYSQLISATLPLSPSISDKENTGSSDEVALVNLKKVLRNVVAELEFVKAKNEELRESKHRLEIQQVEMSHQVTRLQDFEFNNGLLMARIKDLESLRNGYNHFNSDMSPNGSITSSSGFQVQKLMEELQLMTKERDTLKIRLWELEKKTSHHTPHHSGADNGYRPQDFVDLENERNRLVEELGAKTVAMEELWNKNDALMLRASEYEKRVWELESQCGRLEAECSALPTIRADMVELESRAVAGDALVEKVQDLESQMGHVNRLQERVSELETTNAELDHANWDLGEKLNIAHNQHALLSKEFENFRSKDKDDRRLEFLMTRNRELEALLADESKSNPNYREEYEKLQQEMDKLKIRLPQLEGQAKQVALLRSKTLQLEKQVRTMEQLEPRLGEMQAVHERNLFLEGELGELELLRAREMELESELEELKVKTRTTLGGSKSLSRASTSSEFYPSQQQTGAADSDVSRSVSSRSTSQSIADYRSSQSNLFDGPKSPLVKMPSQSSGEYSTGHAHSHSISNWPSGRSSMSMATNRMSASSSTSSSSRSFHGMSAPVSPKEADETTFDVAAKEAAKEESLPVSNEVLPIEQ